VYRRAMGFAAKLGRLEATRPGQVESPLPAERSAALDELRARIQAVLERSVGRPPKPPPRVDDGDLPFAVEPTPLGPLNVRTLRLLASHRTGHAPVLAARSASASWLSLLALDPSLDACDPTRALYLDTETTGLRGGTGTLAFLVGLAFWTRDERGSALIVEQLLLRSPGEEAPILDRVAFRMRDASMIVTFNGKAFDLPLLRTRFAMARMAAPAEPPHLDLVHVARRIHTSRRASSTAGRASPDPDGGLGGCKLTALEERVLGFRREGDVPSGEVSSRYLHFLRTGDGRALLGVVEHNAWDVVAMASLVGLYGEDCVERSALSPSDLVGVSKTLLRAGAREKALAVVERAVESGAGDTALLARARLCKRMGDKKRALSELEALAAARDPSDPAVLLELAKLHEHFAKDPRKALEACLRGTTESPAAAGKRRARLERKIARQDSLPRG
jgi:uncharacterized protein YprB with RNaseH-like and TPR domain